MRACPYCKEKIEENLNICPICGESLSNNKKSFILKSVAIIFILSLILALVFLSYSFYQNRFSVDEIEYKSITNVESSDWFVSHLSVKEIIELAAKQEKDLDEYLKSNHSQKENTGVFRLYYKNLKLLAEALNYTDYNYSKIELFGDSSPETNFVILKTLKEYGVLSEPVYTSSDNKDWVADYFKITNPPTDLLEIISEGEGYFGFHINDSHIADSYAKYLNKSWRDYMYNKKQIYDDLNHNNYVGDGYLVPDSITIARWAVMWEKFLKTYTKFELKDEVVSDFEQYSSNICYQKEPYEYNEKTKKSTLRKDIKEGYEYFLKNANKNTKEYKKIKNNFEILQKNNFEDNEETQKIYSNTEI